MIKTFSVGFFQFISLLNSVSHTKPFVRQNQGLPVPDSRPIRQTKSIFLFIPNFIASACVETPRLKAIGRISMV